MKPISFFNTNINPEASSLVAKTIESTLLSEGAAVQEFEEQLELQFQTHPIVAVNSGTSALHLALALSNIGKGDEVIIPAQTFVATGLAVLYQGATPVFADIKLETGNICIDSIKNLISEKTKAIIPVHWGGLPCRMEEISSIAKENDLIIIEDAAHALGAKYNDLSIGKISQFTCFSFQAIKHLTTGDGGGIAIKDKKTLEKARRIRWFGMDRKNSKPSILGEREYDISEIGYKYHMNDYAATLGIANLQIHKQNQDRVNQIAQLYNEALGSNSSIRLFKVEYNINHAYWLYGFHVDKRSEFIKMMRSSDIPVSVVHQGIDKNSIFKEFRRDLPIQRKFDDSQIHIPIHSDLSNENVYHIINSIEKGW
jgi:perosamine synthetase